MKNSGDDFGPRQLKRQEFDDKKFVAGYKEIISKGNGKKFHYYLDAVRKLFSNNYTYAKEMIVILEKLLETHKKSASLFYGLGCLYFAETFEKMSNALENLTRKDITKERMNWPLTECRKSITYFTKAKEIDHNNPFIDYYLALAYTALDDSSNVYRALKQLDFNLRKFPDFHFRWGSETLGLLLTHNKRFFMRKRFLSICKELTETHPEIQQTTPSLYDYSYIRAAINNRRCYSDEIMKILKNLIKQKGEKSILYYALGHALCVNELQTIRKDLQNYSFVPTLNHVSVGICRKLERSIKYLTKAKKIEPKHPYIHLDLAFFYVLVNNIKSGIGSLKNFRLSQEKTESKVWALLEEDILYLIASYKIKKFLLQKDPNFSFFNEEIENLRKIPNADYLERYLKLLYTFFVKIKKIDYGLLILQSAIKMIPSSASLHEFMARYYLYVGNFAQSIIYLSKAINLYTDEHLKRRAIECRVLIEYAQIRLKWPTFNLFNYGNRVQEVNTHILQMKKIIMENNLKQSNGLLNLSRILEIDRQITYLRSSVGKLDLRARLLSIYENFVSLATSIEKKHTFCEINNEQLLSIPFDHINSIFIAKYVYVTELMALFGVIKKEESNSDKSYWEQLLERTKSYLQQLDYQDGLAAFSRLMRVRHKYNNQEIDNITKEEEDALLKELFNDFAIMDGELSFKILEKLDVIISKMERKSDFEKTRSPAESSSLEHPAAIISREERKIKILTHEGEKPIKDLSNFEKNKRDFHIWFNGLTGEILHRCYPDKQPKLTKTPLQVLFYILINYKQIAFWRDLFINFYTPLDKKQKLETGEYRRIVHNWMWQITSLEHGTFDDCFTTLEAYKGFKLKPEITFCLILPEQLEEQLLP